MAKLALFLDLGSRSAAVLSHKVLDISSHISGGGPCVGHFPALAILCEMHALLWLLVNVYLTLVSGQWSLCRQISCTCIRQYSQCAGEFLV